MPAIAATVSGRVLIWRIGSDVLECNVSRTLMRILLVRGDIVRGSRKVWRYTGEKLSTIAATLLAALREDEHTREAPFVIGALKPIGDVNLTASAEAFGIEREDVEDLAHTVADLNALLIRMPADIPRATVLLAGMRANHSGPASDRKVRAALTAAARAHYPPGRVTAPARAVRCTGRTSAAENGAAIITLADVAFAYAEFDNGELANDALYAAVAQLRSIPDSRLPTPDSRLNARKPIGSAATPRSPIKHAIRWFQQSLRTMRLLQRIEAVRGIWRLAETNTTGFPWRSQARGWSPFPPRSVLPFEAIAKTECRGCRKRSPSLFSARPTARRAEGVWQRHRSRVRLR